MTETQRFVIARTAIPHSALCTYVAYVVQKRLKRTFSLRAISFSDKLSWKSVN
jgi:hypothetical protein